MNLSLYHELSLVLLGLSVVMLATAFFRKRLYLGIVMALYGLAIFNLRYWGFGIPFVLVAAWLLVRAFRLQRDLREATGDSPRAAAQRRGGATKTSAAPAQQALHAAHLSAQTVAAQARERAESGLTGAGDRACG